MALKFEDEVRSFERNDGRVEVTFWGQAAFYWLPDGPMAEKLDEARASRQTVRIVCNGATMEILSVA